MLLILKEFFRMQWKKVHRKWDYGNYMIFAILMSFLFIVFAVIADNTKQLWSIIATYITLIPLAIGILLGIWKLIIIVFNYIITDINIAIEKTKRATLTEKIKMLRKEKK